MCNNLNSSRCIFFCQITDRKSGCTNTKSSTGTKQQINDSERALIEKQVYRFQWPKLYMNVWVYQLRTNGGHLIHSGERRLAVWKVGNKVKERVFAKSIECSYIRAKHPTKPTSPQHILLPK